MRLLGIRWALAIAGLIGCGGKAGEQAKAPDSVPARPAVAALPAGEGKLDVADGTIWYRVVGSGAATPVILLHGGPGFSSYYLKLFERLQDDRPVVRYDQLGGGKSPGLKDTTKITIAHFVAEIDSLRSHLGYQKVHLLGHSWGTILALEYYRAHPDRVVSLVLGSPALDIPAWEKNAKRLLKTLSDSVAAAGSLLSAQVVDPGAGDSTLTIGSGSRGATTATESGDTYTVTFNKDVTKCSSTVTATGTTPQLLSVSNGSSATQINVSKVPADPDTSFNLNVVC